MEQTIEMLKEEARNSWEGVVGEQRATELENYLRNKLKEYSSKLNIPQEEILNAWERDRNYSAINYYQEANQPSLNSDHVKVFDSVKDMLETIGETNFRCPACNGISTNPYDCNSGNILGNGKVCDWKVYGLFGGLEKATFVFIKEKMKGEYIFTPISWEKQSKNQR